MWLGIRFLVGISAGLLLVFLHRSTKSKRFRMKVLLGCVSGLGIVMLLNAASEVLDYSQPATQEVHWANGKLKTQREVTKNAVGEFIPHGKATTWYESGQIKWQGEYRNGRQVGKWTEWHENARKEGEGELQEDGTGFEMHWYPNGQKKSEGPGKYLAEHHCHGKHGKWVTWNEAGQKAAETCFRDNELHGTMTLWYPNGKKKLEAEYADGRMHGGATTWDQDGNVIAEEHYLDGVLTEKAQ